MAVIRGPGFVPGRGRRRNADLIAVEHHLAVDEHVDEVEIVSSLIVVAVGNHTAKDGLVTVIAGDGIVRQIGFDVLIAVNAADAVCRIADRFADDEPPGKVVGRVLPIFDRIAGRRRSVHGQHVHRARGRVDERRRLVRVPDFNEVVLAGSPRIVDVVLEDSRMVMNFLSPSNIFSLRRRVQQAQKDIPLASGGVS